MVVKVFRIRIDGTHIDVTCLWILHFRELSNEF